MKLKARGIVITGSSQGLGRAIAEACITEGAHVALCARDSGLLERTITELRAKAAPGQLVIGQAADVSRAEEVRRFVGFAAAGLPVLTGLVNNAGIYGPKGRLEDVDWREWCQAIEINLMGVALACREALPIFRRNGYGKIVNLSGGGATAPMPQISAYAASKAAVVRLTETLARETEGAGIDVNAVAPGALNTRLLEEVLTAGPDKVGADFYRRALEQKEQGGAPLEKGAALCAFLLSGLSDGISGRLISAVWDPWPNLQDRAAELRKSDVYTLRRIIPADRGFQWE